MRIVSSSRADVADMVAQRLSTALTQALQKHSTVLLLLSSGSWSAIYRSLTLIFPPIDMKNLTLALVDERLVPRGHHDSNEEQMRDTGIIDLCISRGARFIPTLQDKYVDIATHTDITDTTYSQSHEHSSYILMTLGIGSDGHTAGILPAANAHVFDSRFGRNKMFVYYEASPAETNNPHLKRFTITPLCIQKADEVIVYAVGSEKKPVIDRLLSSTDQMYDFPAAILRSITDKVTIYTDSA